MMSGLLIGAVAFALAAMAWPASRWVGSIADLASPHLLVPIALANAVVIIGTYFTFAASRGVSQMRQWRQPVDLSSFATCSEGDRNWRVAHLSDIHVVGERFGFRVESGRSGPRGNDRLAQALAKLDEIHALNPLDLVLITGDVTDAGRSAEWAEFFDALAQYPRIARLVLALPGNHDLNVVDRANPARLDLPMSPKKRLRQMRTISALSAIQGANVLVVDRKTWRLGQTLQKALEPHQAEMATFADKVSIGLSIFSRPAVDDDVPDGQTAGYRGWTGDHYSEFECRNPFLLHQRPRDGLFGASESHRCSHRKVRPRLLDRRASPSPRGISQAGEGAVGTYRHRADQWQLVHAAPGTPRRPRCRNAWPPPFDWIGKCGGLLIVSAPSPVMEATDDYDTYFYVHTLAMGAEHKLILLAPERIELPGLIGNPPMDSEWPEAIKSVSRFGPA